MSPPHKAGDRSCTRHCGREGVRCGGHLCAVCNAGVHAEFCEAFTHGT
jgi:hypothetical protein